MEDPNQGQLFDPNRDGGPVKQPEPCSRCGSRARINGACASCGFGIRSADAKPRGKRRRR